MIFKNFKKIYKEKIKRIKAKYKNKLEEQNRRFINILRHDIKTPILAQINVLELLLKESSSSKELLKEILNSSQFIKEIITNATYLIEFENEKPDLKLENIDILKEINNIYDSIKNIAKEKNQKIIIKSNKKENMSIVADKTMVRKIIYNLLSESMSCGFENSSIEVELKENKKAFSFFAKNKSIYMTKEKINTLLKDNKNDFDLNKLGMKLNLNVAKKLIDAHNWNIVASSNKENTTTFGFIAKKI